MISHNSDDDDGSSPADRLIRNEQSEAGGQRSFVEMDYEFRQDYDALNGLPETPEKEVLHWMNFNEDFYSTPADSKSVEHIMDEHDDAYVDLRPYMIMHSFSCHPHDDLTRVNELFRHHHLRHLPVTNPGNGALVGILTRKDLFAYMAL